MYGPSNRRCFEQQHQIQYVYENEKVHTDLGLFRFVLTKYLHLLCQYKQFASLEVKLVIIAHHEFYSHCKSTK